MRKIFFLAALVFACTPAQAFVISGFDTPESFVSDPADGSYYVSNINGDPLVKDGNGYISKISSNGVTVIQKYIGGTRSDTSLDAPKGLVVVGDLIYVTDIDSVKVFDKNARKLLRKIDLSGFRVKFLNDPAIHSSTGMLYVSDMLTDRIFKIDVKHGDQVTVFVENPALGQPNGLAVNPKTGNLMVVTWKSGRILEIDPSGRIHVLKRGLSSLDGIDYDKDGYLYVSSFSKGEVYKMAFFGRSSIVTCLAGLNTPADISYDRRKDELLIPSFSGQTVTTMTRAELAGKKVESSKA